MGRDRGSPNIKTMSDSILLLNERRIKEEGERVAVLYLAAPETWKDQYVERNKTPGGGLDQALDCIQKSHRGSISDTIKSITVITANQPSATHMATEQQNHHEEGWRTAYSP